MAPRFHDGPEGRIQHSRAVLTDEVALTSFVTENTRPQRKRGTQVFGFHCV